MKFRSIAATGFVLAATVALFGQADGAAQDGAAAAPAPRDAELDRLILIHRGATAGSQRLAEAYRPAPSAPGTVQP